MSNINLGGAQSTRTASIRNMVGLGAVTIVAVNPNKEELENLLGKEISQDPDYSIREDNLGNKSRRISLWFRSEDRLINENIYVSNRPITTKNGDKFKFINSLGQISYFATSAEEIMNNPKVNKWYKPDNLRKLNEGEDTLYSILQNFVRYDAKAEGANWQEVMDNISCTAAALFEGKYDGLRKFVNYINENNNMLIVLHAVTRKETDDGVKYNQKLVFRDETMFRTIDGEVMSWMIEKLRAANDSQIAAGYSLTNADFKISELQQYNPSEFESDLDVPANTAQLLDID